MTKEAENVYSFRMHPKSFYGIESDETILRLAFVFRNADGSKAGKDADGKDFYLDYPGSDSVKSISEVIMESLSKGKGPDSASSSAEVFIKIVLDCYSMLVMAKYR